MTNAVRPYNEQLANRYPTLSLVEEEMVPSPNPNSAMPDPSLPLLEHGGVVHRSRLLAYIGYPPQVPITLITAPAGFGKTTIAAQWAAKAEHQIVWLSLHTDHNTPDRFVEDLEHAIQFRASHSTNLIFDQPSIRDILTRLRRLAAHDHVTIIFDDYQLIESQDVHRMMEALVHELPRGASIILLSRTLPPISLGRLRLEGRVWDVTERVLRFSEQEIRELVASEAVGLLPRQITRLAQKSHGWIASIRLLLLGVQQIGLDLADVAIDHLDLSQWLDDYVVEEVLNRLPTELREFVLKTAVIGRLDADLCDAVLKIDTSATLIDEVIRRLVFARRDVRDEDAVTYHALFVECVRGIARRELSPEQHNELHARTAAWLAQRDRLEAAFDHAIVAEDWNLARQVVRGIGFPLWKQDQSASLLYWLEKLPHDQLFVDHELAYWYIHKLLSNARIREALFHLETIEPAWLASSQPVEQAYSLSCRAFVAAFAGDTGASLQYLYRALNCWPRSHWVERMRGWSSICEREFWRGNVEIADFAYREAEYCRQYLPAGQTWWNIVTRSVRINQYAMRGNLETAERLYRHALTDYPPQLRHWEMRFRYPLAAIYLEWNDLKSAQEQIDLIIEDLEHSPLQGSWQCDAMLFAARVRWETGNYDAAQTILDRLLSTAEMLGEMHTTARARALQAQWWLEQGEKLLAYAWESKVLSQDLHWIQTFGELDPFLTLLQLKAHQHDFQAVNDLASSRIADAEVAKRYADLVPLYVWNAMALFWLDQPKAAVGAFQQALKHGMNGRFIRAFLLPGVDLQPLIAAVLPHLTSDQAAYVANLMLERSTTRMSPPPALAEVSRVALKRLPEEPLSLRESAVLGLINTGLGNRMIAERLFITERTVKKHIGNIFIKLGVQSRTAAVVRARQLGLVPPIEWEEGRRNNHREE